MTNCVKDCTMKDLHYSWHYMYLLVYKSGKKDLKSRNLNAVKCNLKELTTKSAWVPGSAVFGTRMLGGWLHRPCESLARSVFSLCWVLPAIFFPSRPSPRPVGFFSPLMLSSVWRVPFPFLWCGGSWLGCAVVPVMGTLFQSRGWLPIVETPGYFRHPTSILAMQLLIYPFQKMVAWYKICQQKFATPW